MLENFSFVMDGVLAGSARPGAYGDLTADLDEARRCGISAVVSLTERGLPPPYLAQAGLAYLHEPVEDFHPPGMDQVARVVKFIEAQAGGGGGAVLVHCAAGIGRTGTMLAAFLVARGMEPAEAIDRVRDLRPGSIETREQEQAVYDWKACMEGGAN